MSNGLELRESIISKWWESSMTRAELSIVVALLFTLQLRHLLQIYCLTLTGTTQNGPIPSRYAQLTLKVVRSQMSPWRTSLLILLSSFFIIIIAKPVVSPLFS